MRRRTPRSIRYRIGLRTHTSFRCRNLLDIGDSFGGAKAARRPCGPHAVQFAISVRSVCRKPAARSATNPWRVRSRRFHDSVFPRDRPFAKCRSFGFFLGSMALGIAGGVLSLGDLGIENPCLARRRRPGKTRSRSALCAVSGREVDPLLEHAHRPGFPFGLKPGKPVTPGSNTYIERSNQAALPQFAFKHLDRE